MTAAGWLVVLVVAPMEVAFAYWVPRKIGAHFKRKTFDRARDVARDIWGDAHDDVLKGRARILTDWAEATIAEARRTGRRIGL